MSVELFSVPIAAIFARELLEASIIIGQYRTLVQRSDVWDEARKPVALKMIWFCAGCAAAFAILLNVVVAIILAVLGNKLDKTAAIVIEGVSKVVAAFCILQLSLKVPKWLSVGPYGDIDTKKTLGVTDRELYFNVTWNIWREVAEIGVFLIPFFLQGDLEMIPISALVGVIIGVGLGALVYVALRFTKQKIALAVAMSVITGWLACGLFTGGMHEFEEVLGETPSVFYMPGCESEESCTFWHHKKFPGAFIKPFGYSHHPSVLQMVSFWLFAAFLILMHTAKYKLAQRRAKQGSTKDSNEVITGAVDAKEGDSKEHVDVVVGTVDAEKIDSKEHVNVDAK
jgi:high-affinity iron transporter